MALYGVALALALLIASAVMGAVLAVRDMRDQADVSLTNAKARIESSVAESFKLLESLAEQPTLYDRSVPVMDKVTMLDQVNEHFGYFLLCYVDDEMNVWDVTGSASLASRDFMQKCYSTGQGLVTDSFAAGADGVTLNYVVLAPLFDGGEMTGSLFVSLYFDDMVRILAESAVGPDVGSVLIGSRGQTMSATSGFVYDDMFLDPLRSSIAFGMTADVVERELMALNPVSFWTRRRIGCTILHGRSYRRYRMGRRMRDELLGRVHQGHGRARSADRRRFGDRRGRVPVASSRFHVSNGKRPHA